MMVPGQYRPVLVGIWSLVVVGQYNLVLFGIKWYWVNKGLLCLYILKKLMVTSTDQPTDQPTGRIQSNLPFRILENRKKAEICNIHTNTEA